MVILLFKNGQLCNRLFTISAFVANCIEHNYPMLTNSFSDYQESYSSINTTSRNYKIRFLKPTDHLQNKFIKLAYKLVSKFPKGAASLGFSSYTKGGNINNPDFVSMAADKKLFVNGWPFWDVDNFIKHSETIKKIFTPNANFFNKARSFIENSCSGHNVLVGVHMRLGDYKYYMKGRFYFSSKTYCKQINDLYLQFVTEGKNPLFIICCNEKITIDWKVPFSYVISDMDAISDLILLSECDYIVGPPSTYSMWASFYGNVPYNNFFDRDDELMLKDFSNIIAPSTFANGRELKDIYEKYSI